jgi:hypothetical protein
MSGGGDAGDEGEIGVPDLPPGVVVSLRRAEVWTVPPADLFDRIVVAATSAPSSTRFPARRRWVALGAAAAAALVVFAAGFVLRGITDDDPDESAGGAVGARRHRPRADGEGRCRGARPG